MPTGALIYASSAEPLSSEQLATLEDDIQNQITPERFCGPEGRALLLLGRNQRDFDFAELQSATTVIEVRPVTPYYGRGYTRGDWTELAAILEFLRRRIPECRV